MPRSITAHVVVPAADAIVGGGALARHVVLDDDNDANAPVDCNQDEDSEWALNNRLAKLILALKANPPVFSPGGGGGGA